MWINESRNQPHDMNRSDSNNILPGYHVYSADINYFID
jgi:hypothetical protein